MVVSNVSSVLVTTFAMPVKSKVFSRRFVSPSCRFQARIIHVLAQLEGYDDIASTTLRPCNGIDEHAGGIT